jgi:hypothetical protein
MRDNVASTPSRSQHGQKYLPASLHFYSGCIPVKDPATGHGLCLDEGGGDREDEQDDAGDGGHVQYTALEGHHI